MVDFTSTLCGGRPTPITLFSRSWAVVFGVPEVCPVTMLFDGNVKVSGARGGDVEPMPRLGLVGLRGLSGLRPPVRPCGVDMLDRTGVTVGGDMDLRKESINYDKIMNALAYIPRIPNNFILLIL